ncbi:MAG: hypothetical protein JWN98_1046 [Abditibacteriota bacterium]|nr:hypothetical protein [Abditibacteriota bacterium]
MSALLVITMGLIQYGIIYNAVGTLTHLAREGARFAAIHAMDSTTTVNGVTSSADAAIRNYIRWKAQSTSITVASLPDDSIVVTPAPGNSARSSGQPITITITYDLRRKLFLGSKFPGLSRLAGVRSTSMTHVIE